MLHRLLHAREALGKEQVCTLLHGRVDEPGGSIGWSIGNDCFGHLIVMAEPADKVCNALGVRPRLHSLGLLRGKPSERWCLSPNDDYTPGRPDADRMCASDGTFCSAGQPLTEFVTLYHSCRGCDTQSSHCPTGPDVLCSGSWSLRLLPCIAEQKLARHHLLIECLLLVDHGKRQE